MVTSTTNVNNKENMTGVEQKYNPRLMTNLLLSTLSWAKTWLEIGLLTEKRKRIKKGKKTSTAMNHRVAYDSMKNTQFAIRHRKKCLQHLQTPPAF